MIIDLSNEFRLQKEANQSESFDYGYQIIKEEFNKPVALLIQGVLPAIQLTLLPLAHHQSINNSVHINAVTGSTGAGVGLVPPLQLTESECELV